MSVEFCEANAKIETPMNAPNVAMSSRVEKLSLKIMYPRIIDQKGDVLSRTLRIPIGKRLRASKKHVNAEMLKTTLRKRSHFDLLFFSVSGLNF